MVANSTLSTRKYVMSGEVVGFCGNIQHPREWIGDRGERENPLNTQIISYAGIQKWILKVYLGTKVESIQKWILKVYSGTRVELN